MGIGTILVGAACALVVGAYLARPFRKTEPDLDRAIEAWIAQVRKGGEAEVQGSNEAAEAVNFCPQCGRHVGHNDHFCPGCGAKLPRGAK